MNFCNNVIEPINIRGIRKKNKGGSEKKGGENSPTSPPLDPRLNSVIFLPKRRLVLLWATLATSSSQAIGTFRLDYEYEIEYEYDFRI